MGYGYGITLAIFVAIYIHDIDAITLSSKPLISSKMIWKMPEKVATTQILGTTPVSA